MPYGEVKPVGNDYLLTYGNSDFYETRHENAREFALCLGMLNNKGGSEPSNLQDKVRLYLGMDMVPGAGDGWLLNGVLTIHPGVAKNAQWAEIDLNNNSQHFGATPGVMGLAAPAVYLYTFNGYSQFDITGGLLFSQAGVGKLCRNIVFANGCRYSGIENYDSMTALIENNGAPEFVLRSLGLTSKLQVMGSAAFGCAPVSGFAHLIHGQGDAIAQMSGVTSARYRLAAYGADIGKKYLDAFWSNGALHFRPLHDNGALKNTPLTIDGVTGVLSSATLPALNFVSDAAAAGGGVPVGGIYHNAGALRVRLV